MKTILCFFVLPLHLLLKCWTNKANETIKLYFKVVTSLYFCSCQCCLFEVNHSITPLSTKHRNNIFFYLENHMLVTKCSRNIFPHQSFLYHWNIFFRVFKNISGSSQHFLYLLYVNWIKKSFTFVFLSFAHRW